MKNILYFFLFFLINYSAFSQNNGEGRLLVIQDERIKDIIEKRKVYNEKKGTIPGFRVQIFFDSGNNARNKANTIRSSFMAKYPEIETYLSFQQPYFKVRVGNFRTRFEAEKFVKIIEQEYPGCFIVKDEIELPKLY